MTEETCLWRRLDVPGHDACRFLHDGLGWVTEGTALFPWQGRVANLAYRLRCDDDWVSRSAAVHGWIGDMPLTIEIARTEGDGWTVDGIDRADLAGLSDIDLGFTPATNTNAIRRLNLAAGETGETVALWLDDGDWTVKPLPQAYTRVAEDHYDFASPGFGARLVTDGFGKVVDYPGLWASETARIAAPTA